MAPEALLPWTQAEVLVGERGYSRGVLFAAFRAGDLEVYSPHLHPHPMKYADVSGNSEMSNDEGCKRWLRNETSVDTDVIDRCWPDQSASSVAVGAHKKRGGRPSKYDWANLSAYLAAYVVENDYPGTQAELVQVANQWFEQQSASNPDPRTVERWIRDLYEARDALKQHC